MGRRRTPVAVPVDLTWGLYRFHDAAGDLLYIGITRRDQLARLVEHLRKQPWAGEIAGWQVDPQVYLTEAAALAAERDAIHRERPRYNDKHNHHNPHRVVVQRPGTPRRARPAASVRPQSRRRRRSIRRTWWRRRPTWAATTWLITAAALWVAIGGRVDAGTGVGLSGLVASGLTWVVFKK